MKSGGFTLIETLIALTIAATAAAVILANVRSLLQRAEQEHRLMLIGSRLLSEATLARAGLRPVSVPSIERERAILASGNASVPPLAVYNFSLAGEKPLPPVELAFTPYQRYAVEYEGKALSFLGKALIPPKDSSSALTKVR